MGYRFRYEKMNLYLAYNENNWLSLEDPTLRTPLDEKENKAAIKNRIKSFINTSDIDTVTTGNIFKVSGLDIVGLSDDSEKVLYCRNDTTELIRALERMNRAIRIQSSPGLGISTTVWL
jgi:hypothetical protein